MGLGLTPMEDRFVRDDLLGLIRSLELRARVQPFVGQRVGRAFEEAAAAAREWVAGSYDADGYDALADHVRAGGF
jgi:hypothetical protein